MGMNSGETHAAAESRNKIPLADDGLPMGGLVRPELIRAALGGISPITHSRMIARGEAPPPDIKVGHLRLFNVKTHRAFLESKRVGVTGGTTQLLKPGQSRPHVKTGRPRGRPRKVRPVEEAASQS